MAELGYHPATPGGVGANSDLVVAMLRVQAVENGDVTAISLWVTGTGVQFTLGIYADSAGLPGARLGVGVGDTTAGTGYQSQNLASPVSITSGSFYWLVCHCAAPVNMGKDAATNDSYFVTGTYSHGSLPDPFGGSPTEFNDVLWAMYATYTPTSSGATSYTFEGPTSGLVNAESTDFTVTPNGDADGIEVTPATDGAGSFTPASVTFSGSDPETFTYTPTSTSGSPHTLSVTDDGGLTDPASIDYTVTSGTVAITTPAANKFHQRHPVDDEADVPITGTYTGSPTAIEADLNGSGYQTIDPSPSGGTYSGTLTSPAGRGTLTVRFANDTAVTATVTDVRIGDAFVVAGDSHNEGRGDNPQTGNADVSYFREDDARATGNDPADTGTGSGSHWPLLGVLIAADQGVPVEFITCAEGGTDLNTTGTKNTWSPGNGNYTNMQSQVTAADVGANGVRGVLLSVGGNAMGVDAPSQSVYNAAVDLFANSVASDLPGAPKVVLGLFGDASTYPRADLDAVRMAIREAQNDNANVLPGYVLIDQSYSDDVHAATDAELLVMARRLFVCLKEHFYGGGSGYGRGPRVSGNITLDSSKKFLTVTFDRDLAAGTTYGGFRVLDGGTPATIVSATRASSRRVVIEVDDALSAAGNVTVSFGSGGDAVGQTVPTSTAITLPDANTVTLPAEPFVEQAVSAEGSGGGSGGGGLNQGVHGQTGIGIF